VKRVRLVRIYLTTFLEDCEASEEEDEGNMTIGLKHKHNGQAADLQAANPWQEEPILWNASHEPGSPISGKPYRQDTSLTWFP